METFVVYLHVNPIKQEIFYVGIGDEHRPYSKHSRNRFWKNIAQKYGYEVYVIHENLSWEKAQELEIYYVSKIGRRITDEGPLVNLTLGGEGTIGYRHTEEARKKISDSNRTRTWRVESRMKLGDSHRGKKLTEEHKEKLRLKFTGVKLPERTQEHNDRISKALIGKKHSEEVKQRVRERRVMKTCPYCNRSGDSSTFTRYHFEKCKMK